MWKSSNAARRRTNLRIIIIGHGHPYHTQKLIMNIINNFFGKTTFPTHLGVLIGKH